MAPEIIAGMQQLALEQRRLLGPRADWHVGDIAWGFRQHEGRESEWKIRHWIEDGRVVAWSWLKQDGRNRLEHDVHPDYLHLLDEILAEPAAEVAFAFEDDTDRRAALARHGFTEPGDVMHFLVRELARAARGAAAAGRLSLPDGRRPRTSPSASRSIARLGALARHRVELRAGSGRVAVSRVARLRRRGAGRPLRRVLPLLARRPERRRRVRAGRHARGVPPPRPRCCRLHVRAPAAARGRHPPGDRLLRLAAGVRAVRVARVPHSRIARRVLAAGATPSSAIIAPTAASRRPSARDAGRVTR